MEERKRLEVGCIKDQEATVVKVEEIKENEKENKFTKNLEFHEYWEGEEVELEKVKLKVMLWLQHKFERPDTER